MRVGSSPDQTQSGTHKLLGHNASIFHDSFLVRLEIGPQRLAERHGFRGNRMHQRAALNPRENALVQRYGPVLRAQDEAAARAAQRLVRRGRDEVG